MTEWPGLNMGTKCCAKANVSLFPELFNIVGILQEEGWPSRQALGGWVPKWAQEALGSLITCRQCSNAIKEVDPGNGRRASFILKTDKLLCRFCFQWPCFLTALGFGALGFTV